MTNKLKTLHFEFKRLNEQLGEIIPVNSEEVSFQSAGWKPSLWVRLDVAKEREKRLIKEAYLRGAVDRNTFATAYPDGVEDEIYKALEWEKLK